MRMMLRVTMGLEKSNQMAKDGKLGAVMARTMEQIKPEAAYFTAIGGKRTALYFFDLKETSEIPSIAEPLFSEVGAEIEFLPCMNAQELKTGLENAAKRR